MNGLKTLGENSREIRLLESSSYGVDSPGRASRWVETEVRRFCLRNGHVPESMSVRRVLLRLEDGIFIIRLNASINDGTIVDHVIAVDFKERVF